ncbi:MAG: LysR substrate-binding domain-containing protein [Verrucomicrobiota bacterium]
MLDSQKIQSFFAVVEHRSLSSAALALRVSQPTLTRQMQGLESDFKTPLFLRSGRGMTLTEAGQRLYSGLQGIDRQLRSLREDVAASLIEPTGEVAVGIPPSPRRLIAVPLVQQFARANPRVTVRIVEETSGQLRDLVANGVLDIAITNSHEPMHGVSAEPLGREPLLLVGPRTAKLSMVKPIPLTALAQYPLILTNLPNSLRVIIETGLKVEGLQPNTRVVADALPLMTDLVTAGLGYTVLPACGVRALLKERALTASPIENLSITWMVAKPLGRSLSLAAQRFYDAIVAIAARQVVSGVWQSG